MPPNLIIDSILVAGRLLICCTNIIGLLLLGADEANANIANGNPILNKCGLTRERQRQYHPWETNVGPIFMLSGK